jgi:hypothetical protein
MHSGLFLPPTIRNNTTEAQGLTTLSENINGDNEAYKTTHDTAANWKEVQNKADWEKSFKEVKVCIGL